MKSLYLCVCTTHYEPIEYSRSNCNFLSEDIRLVVKNPNSACENQRRRTLIRGEFHCLLFSHDRQRHARTPPYPFHLTKKTYIFASKSVTHHFLYILKVFSPVNTFISPLNKTKLKNFLPVVRKKRRSQSLKEKKSIMKNQLKEI